MPKFSQQSFSRLSTCHIDLQTLFYEVVKHFDCTILVGFRNEEDQNKAYHEGNSRLKWPNSKHNQQPSLAVDVAPYPLPDWRKKEDFIYFCGYVMGVAKRLKEEGKITHSIRWGGDFNRNQRVSDSVIGDFLHFEIDN
jgi:peptidoglycan L-alanyl-D-glutamate endopeptidase CwlK